MPPITVFRAARPDNKAQSAAINRATAAAEAANVGLTYFVPRIGDLRATDLSDVLPKETLTNLANNKLFLDNGRPVRRVSTLTPRHEDGVVLALWTQPALAVDLEKCTLAKAVFVVTNTEDELDVWIEKTGAVVA